MNKTSQILLALIAATALSGCESAKKAFGGKKSAPDEFVVYSRPPLSQPPDFTLRAPTPGVERPQGTSTTDVARQALFGNPAASQPPAAPGNAGTATPGVQALLKNTGATTADPDIRRKINSETSVLADEDEEFVNKLIFWVDDKPAPGTVLDPKKEQKRIREAQALGKPITEGATEHVKRKATKKGLLEF